DQDWLAAHSAHLREEKQLTRQRDALFERRRQLPWRRITQDYRFHDASGAVRLSELFEGRSQLVIKHFMFGPDWSEGCVGCSFEADHIGGALLHLHGVLGVERWRCLFLLEGVPACLRWSVVLPRLPDTPAPARWPPAAVLPSLPTTLCARTHCRPP
ncbi:DUF899 family protein, partial [Burkholderia cenocepacia]|uniref:DUF899 family protein n=1 Tax=Burkholderia cenocepacia TaxID=95486 RepID=UPI00406C26ED